MKTLMLLVLFLLAGPSATANDMWCSIGAGVGSEGWAGHLSGSLQISRHLLFGLRLVETRTPEAVNGGGWFDGGERFYPGARDVGLLLGWVNVDRKDNETFSLSIGAGTVTVTERGDWVDAWLFGDYWEKEETTTTGMLMQSQLFFGKYGFTAFADFNSIKSFGGLVFNYRFSGAF